MPVTVESSANVLLPLPYVSQIQPASLQAAPVDTQGPFKGETRESRTHTGLDGKTSP